MIDEDNKLSLLRYRIIYCRKKFYIIGLWFNVRETFKALCSIAVSVASSCVYTTARKRHNINGNCQMSMVQWPVL